MFKVNNKDSRTTSMIYCLHIVHILLLVFKLFDCYMPTGIHKLLFTDVLYRIAVLKNLTEFTGNTSDLVLILMKLHTLA